MASGLYSGVSGIALGTGLYRNVSGLWSGASGFVTGYGGGSPYGGASLYLDFLTMTAPTFDSRITFTRGSNATLVDSTGKVTYAPANLLTYSEQFDNAAWTKTGAGVAIAPVVTANAGAAPDGTTTAGRVQFDCGNTGSAANRSYISPFAISQPAGISYVASVYVKAYDAANVGKTIQFTVDAVQTTVVTLTATWQRISIYGLASTTITNFIIETRGTFTTQTADVLLWGAQLEPVTYQTTPGTYQATTTSAYYGPRFDYDPVTLAAKGLLIEEARTNLLTYSEDITNAAWLMLGTAGASRTANAATAPDGTNNADRYTVGTGSGAWYIANYANQNIASGQAYTFSTYVKANGLNYVFVRPHNNSLNLGSSGFIASLIDGTITYPSAPTAPASTGTATNVGNGWWRVTATSTANATVTPSTGGPGIWPCNSTSFSAAGGTAPANFTGDGTSGVYIWGAQLEAGAFATSYIPTVASTVTRSADVATMTGTNFSNWYNQTAGSFVFDADSFTAAAVDFPLTASDGTANNRFGIYRSSAAIGGYVTTGGVAQMDLTRSSITANTAYKAAVAATANDGNMALNGAAAAGDTSITMPTVDRLGIGNSNGSGFMSGHIRAIVYFNSRQANATLQSLTT